MDKRRNLSGGVSAELMKNGEGTGVKGERGLADFKVVGGVFSGGPVDKCLVSGCKSWKVVLQSDVYEKRWREGNVNRILSTPTHTGTLGVRTSTPIHTHTTHLTHTTHHTQIRTQKHRESNFVHYV